MNREKELGRIRFMLGEHAEVLDRACSPMEILEAANATGYRGEQNDDAAWEFLRPKIEAAVAALENLQKTDKRAREYMERNKHVMSEDEFSDFLASVNCTDGDGIAEFRRLFIESGQLQAAA